MSLTLLEREMTGNGMDIQIETKKHKVADNFKKEEGRQGSNPRRESEVGELVERVTRGCCLWECSGVSDN